MLKKHSAIFFLLLMAAFAACSGEGSTNSDKEEGTEEKVVIERDTANPVTPDNITTEEAPTVNINLSAGMTPLREVPVDQLSELLNYDLVDLGNNYNGMVTVNDQGVLDGAVDVKTLHPQSKSFCQYKGEFKRGYKSGIWEIERKKGDENTRFTLQVTFDKDQCMRSALKGVFDPKVEEYFQYYMEGGQACNVDGMGEAARKRWLKEKGESTDPEVEATAE